MAIDLYTRTETITLPGAIVSETQCLPADQCCETPVEPGEYDCETPNLGTLPDSVVVTLSGPTGPQSGMFSLWETYNSVITDCTSATWLVGYLRYLSAWRNGSVSFEYLGLFNAGTDVNPHICSTLGTDCDYHVYALSTTPITPGSINGSDLDAFAYPLDGSESLPCCCDPGPHLYFDRTTEEYSFEYTTGRSLCGQVVGGFEAPCDIQEIVICDGVTAWYSKDLIDACVGVACAGGTGIYIPNGDTLGGLYCDAGTIDQHPTRLRFYVYRQAFLFIPQETVGEPDCCDADGFVVLKTYLVRRRWQNDGVSDVINEPTVWAWDQTIAITFAGDGTISGTGVNSPPLCNVDCDMEEQDVEVSA